MPKINARVSYLIDKLEDDIETGIHCAIIRTWKHRDDEQPSDEACAALVDNCVRETMGAIYEALDFHDEDDDDPPAAYDCDDCGVEQAADDDD